MLTGNRIPRAFFATQGAGESDNTVHAGSFHLALREAGIERANIITYSSILPRDCREISRDDAAPRMVWGEVMECIAAIATCEYGGSATAALGYGWLVDRVTGEREGGLVAEYSGSLAKPFPLVRAMLSELHQPLSDTHMLSDVVLLAQQVTPVKMYGTAVVALCFTEYEVPVLHGD